ncbi:hypothetical protein IPZ61_04580 [Streptomyces sioyaensis]|nr:hypothetical protein [Streptomyces sioyaensis]MCF3172592.1 hypothetical protein [Streptomyces sioyaensis]
MAPEVCGDRWLISEIGGGCPRSGHRRREARVDSAALGLLAAVAVAFAGG